MSFNRRGKVSKAELDRAEVNSRLEFDLVKKTVIMSDGREVVFPVKVYREDKGSPEPLDVQSE